MSLIEQAEKFKKAIQKITAKEITSQTEKCLRLYKAVVVSVANGTTMGVQLVGDGTTLYLPYSTDAQSATISNVVWVQVIANNFRNATIITQADIQHTASVEPGDLSQYQTKTDNSLETPDKTVVGAINANYAAIQEKIPFRLLSLQQTTGFRQVNGNIYVNSGTNGENQSRMSMTDLKNLNTKVIFTTNEQLSTDETDSITVGDVVCKIN